MLHTEYQALLRVLARQRDTQPHAFSETVAAIDLPVAASVLDHLDDPSRVPILVERAP